MEATNNIGKFFEDPDIGDIMFTEQEIFMSVSTTRTDSTLIGIDPKELATLLDKYLEWKKGL